MQDRTGHKMIHGSAIRDAERRDAALLARLIRESFRDVATRFSLTPTNCPKHPSNCETSWVEADWARGAKYFIVTLGGEPVGCVGLEHRDEGVSSLEHLAVLPQYRGRGLGRSLVQHALSKAQANGSSRLGAAIIADHAELKHWYLRMGFAETETKTFPHLPFAVTFLQRTIPGAAGGATGDINAETLNPHP